MFLPQPGGYPVYAQAVEASVVIAFDNESYTRLLKGPIDSCFAVMSAVSPEAARAGGGDRKPGPAQRHHRLVFFLLQQIGPEATGRVEVTLLATKSLLPSRLSIQPETFSRILARLSRQGLINVEGQTIVTEDAAQLPDAIVLMSKAARASP